MTERPVASPDSGRAPRLALLLLLAGVLVLAGCATGPRQIGGTQETVSSYTVFGETYYVLASAAGFEQIGVASWYGRNFHGQATASGEIYDMYALTAAHKTLPLGTLVRVTNLANGRQVTVRINDRGPFSGARIVDLSYAAARRIGIVDSGTARVRVAAVATAGDGPVSRPVGARYIQVGAFASRENAVSQRQRVRRLGLDDVVIRPPVGEYSLYRVRIGPLADRDQRQRVRRRLRARGIDSITVDS